MKRPKCPKCGSTSLYGWIEIIETNYYNLDKDGNYSVDKDDAVIKSGDCGYGADGYQCKKCGCKWNAMSGYILSEGD